MYVVNYKQSNVEFDASYYLIQLNRVKVSDPVRKKYNRSAVRLTQESLKVLPSRIIIPERGISLTLLWIITLPLSISNLTITERIFYGPKKMCLLLHVVRKFLFSPGPTGPGKAFRLQKIHF